MMAPVFIKTTLLGGAMRHSFWTVDGRTNFCWPLPQDGKPGAWLIDSKPGPLQPHRTGINLAKPDYLLQYINTENYLAEVDGEYVEGSDCVVARKVRLTEKIETTPEQWRTLGLDYAIIALELVREIDKVRSYLQENEQIICGAFEKVAQHYRAGARGSYIAPQVREAERTLQLQVARFAYDVASSGVYKHPVKAALHLATALRFGLNLLASKDNQLDYASTVKEIASETAMAAGELAADYAIPRPDVALPCRLAALALLPPPSARVSYEFRPQVEKAMFDRQNALLLRMMRLDQK